MFISLDKITLLSSLDLGGGGGSEEVKNGFIDYNDTSTTTTPIVMDADVWYDIPNDGLGGFTNKNTPPEGVSELMFTPSGEFDFSELSLGDTVLIRNDFQVTPQTNNALLDVRYELGVGASPYYLEVSSRRLDSGSGVPYGNEKPPFLIYMGDTNTRDNPCKLQVRLSAGGVLVNSGSVVWVDRR